MRVFAFYMLKEIKKKKLYVLYWTPVRYYYLNLMIPEFYCVINYNI